MAGFSGDQTAAGAAEDETSVAGFPHSQIGEVP
jgi:hypothetical protein